MFSDGEEVGVLLRDGTIHYTATRTVTFEGWGGAVLQTENVRLFQPAVAPADVAAPEGYAFVGWDRGFSRIDRDLTVKALFEAVPAPEPDPNAGGGNESGNGAGESGGSSGVSGKTVRASSSGMRAGCLADTGDAAEGRLRLLPGSAWRRLPPWARQAWCGARGARGKVSAASLVLAIRNRACRGALLLSEAWEREKTRDG